MVRREYKCKDCKFNFEAMQSIKDETLKSCPECGGTLYQVYGEDNPIYFFDMPGVGAVSNRFATRGNGTSGKYWTMKGKPNEGKAS